MDTPDEMRAKAAKARRIAATMTGDKLTIERLHQLADELEKQANAEERDPKS